MRGRRSLRYRVAIAFALFGGLISVLLGIWLYVASHNLERQLIDETLASELDDYIGRHILNPLSLPPITATIRGFVFRPGAPERAVPAIIGTLSPGHHDIRLNGTPFRVAVSDDAGWRYAVLYNERLLQRRELGFIAIVASGVLLSSLFAAFLGFRLAGRVISPVTNLAHRVTGLRPEDDPPPLADDFPWDEVRDLARDFDRYLARLRAFIERERAFVGDASHELRTPLTVIRGACEVLLANDDLPAPARIRVERIERASREANELIDALLTLAREQAVGQVDQVTDVAELVQETVEKLQVAFRAKPIEVQMQLHARPKLPASRAALGMVIGNLLRNAYSFTDHGVITVELEPTRVRIADTGVGIDRADLEKVFEPYYRGRASRGSGIGLSLVRRICERHGWRISIDSRPGGGTCSELQFLPDPAQSPDINPIFTEI